MLFSHLMFYCVIHMTVFFWKYFNNYTVFPFMNMPQLIICYLALYNSVGTITFLNFDVYSNVWLFL